MISVRDHVADYLQRYWTDVHSSKGSIIIISMIAIFITSFISLLMPGIYNTVKYYFGGKQS